MAMSQAEKQAREEQADRKASEGATRAYNKASSTPASDDPRDSVRGQRAYKKGGKVRKYEGGGGVTTDELETANNSADPIESLNAQKGWTGTEESSGSAKASTPSKQRVVSKKELEASGLSLRDFLNKERGLTRRDGAAPAKAAPKVTDTGDEVARLAVRKAAPAKPKYETSYDRMNRQNREAESSRASAKDSERAALAKNIREGSSGKINPKTLLPESGFKKGGSVKGWGIARGARAAKVR